MYNFNKQPFKMSKQMMNNNRNQTQFQSRAPKCLTCERAGVTGKALEHYTRKTQDPNSEIICPTILSFKCGYCGQNGHSRGFCQALKVDQTRIERDQIRVERDDERRRNERRVEDERQRQETTRRLKSNIFSAFNDDDEDNERADALKAEVEALKAQLAVKEEETRIKEAEAAFPSLSKKPVKQQAPTVQFALVAKNAAHLPIPKPKTKSVVEEPIEYDNDYDEDSEQDYDQDYTEHVQDDSFVAYDPYERPSHAAKYFTEEHEIEQMNAGRGNVLFKSLASTVKNYASPCAYVAPAPTYIAPTRKYESNDDDDW